MAPVSLFEEGLQQFRTDALSKYKNAKDQAILNEFLAERASANDVASSMSNLRDSAGTKYSAVKLGKVEVIPTKWIDNILGNIHNFITVGNMAMISAPESIGLAWYATKTILSAIESNYKLYALFGSGLTDITEIMVVTQHYDRLYDERNLEHFKQSDLVGKLFETIRKTYSQVLDFSLAVKRHISGDKVDKARHAFKDILGLELSKFQDKLNSIADLKKDILEKSQGAFQDKTLKGLGNLQSLVQDVQANVGEIRDFQKVADQRHVEQMELLDSVRQGMDAMLEANEPKGRWQLAQQEFERIKKRLNPLERANDAWKLALDQKHEGTCGWIFEHEFFTDWRDSEDHDLLCLIGPPDVGKSVVAASVFDHFKTEAKEDEYFVTYFSCAPTRKSDGLVHDLEKLTGTLLSTLHEQAAHDSRDVDLLEKCNQVLGQYRDRKKDSATQNGSKEKDDLPDLSDSLVKLAEILSKRVIIVLDAVDRMSDADQKSLSQSLIDLTEADAEAETCVHIFVSNRTNSDFMIKNAGESASIAAENHTGPDIEKTLTDLLDEIPGWMQQERDEAKEKILEKAGSIFRYISEVGIKHVRQPFQRPISNHLKNLPEGVSEALRQHVRSLSPNYLALLRVALNWTLFATKRIKAAEIMETFQGTYDIPEDEAKKIADAEPSPEDDSSSAFSTDLAIEQLKHAAGPFLDIVTEDNNQTWVSVRDSVNIRKFCEPGGLGSVKDECSNSTHCASCAATRNAQADLAMDPMETHLKLATTMVRRLCSPLFQKRYWLDNSDDENEEEDDDDEKEDEEKGEDTEDEEDGEEEDDEESKDTAKTDADAPKETSTEDNEAVDTQGSASDNDSGVELAGKDTAGQQDDDNDDAKSDESLDQEDRDELSLERINAPKADEWVWIDNFESYPLLRYEVFFWPYHVRQAEKLAKDNDFAKDPLWQELMDALDTLVTKCPTTFRRWSSKISQYDGHYYRSELPPLHVAAYFGLQSWARYLIKNGKDVEELNEVNATPVQVASMADDNLEMLQLLFESGADINRSTREGINPPMYNWLVDDVSVEFVQLLMKSTFDLKGTNPTNGWTILHYLALNSEDPASLEVVLNAPNGPDINHTSNTGRTALHVLLNRDGMPPASVLQAFLDHGADLNIDDDDSVRPFSYVAYSGDRDTLQLIMASEKLTDIDDPDKHGRCAIHDAAWRGHTEFVKDLLEHGSSINIVDQHGRTPLFFACLGGHDDTVKLLLEGLRKANFPISEINKSTLRKRTPLRQLASLGFTELLKDILSGCSAEDAKAMVNIADTRKGLSPLHYAAWKGKFECVQSLLDFGADADAKDYEGRKALTLAYQQWQQSEDPDYEGIIIALINEDPDAAARDSELIAAAAIKGNCAVLQVLENHKADFTVPDQYGWTPLFLARQFDNTEAEEFIRRAASVNILPSAWQLSGAGTSVSEDGLSITHTSGIRMCLSANKPIPAGLDKFYFEITSVAMEDEEDEQEDNPEMAIGFCTIGAKAFRFPGWEPKSSAPSALAWAYHGDDGGLYHNANQSIDGEDPYAPGDTIGCGVDLEEREIWFTVNGKKLETTFDGVRGRLIPIVGLRQKVKLETNFGSKPFKWDGKDVESDEEDSDADSEASNDEDEKEAEGGDGDSNAKKDLEPESTQQPTPPPES